MEKQIKNMLRLFLNSIRDYELESGNKICHDERDSEEFVNIFLDSEDAFDYKEILTDFNEAISLLSEAMPIWRSDTKNWEGWCKDTDKLKEKYDTIN